MALLSRGRLALVSGSLLALAAVASSRSSSASGGIDVGLGATPELDTLYGTWTEECPAAPGADLVCVGGWELRFGRAEPGGLETFASRFGACGELGDDVSSGTFAHGPHTLTLSDCLHGETIAGLFDSSQREFGYSVEQGGQRLTLTELAGAVRVFRRER